MIDASSLTELRDLRTGVPVWADEPRRAWAVQPLTASTRADVVIVGAGITGALLAEAVTARGLSVIILDRRPPCHGSTAASTALLQFELDTPLIHLADDIGFEAAQRVWLRSFRAVADLATLVRRLGIACDFRPRKAIYLAGNVLGAADLAKEGELRRTIGLPSLFLGHEDLRGFAGVDREAALLSDGAADVNPVSLTDGVLRRAAARGARIFSPAELTEITPAREKVAMVSAAVELEARALIWEAAKPYLYIRTTASGRVLMGRLKVCLVAL